MQRVQRSVNARGTAALGSGPAVVAESSTTTPSSSGSGSSDVHIDGWGAQLEALSSAMLSSRQKAVHAAVDRFLALPVPI